MVLNELGRGITSALAAMANTMVIDEAALDECLKEICKALLQSDVNVRLVANLRNNVKKRVNVEELAAGLNKRKIIEKAVFDELCSMLDGGGDDGDKAGDKKAAAAGGKDGSGSYGVRKGKPHVVMFVGLQGSGKTTTCTKYAYWHKKKNWKPALVCADTFRAGAAGVGGKGARGRVEGQWWWLRGSQGSPAAARQQQQPAGGPRRRQAHAVPPAGPAPTPSPQVRSTS
jgi:signal recognition particle subunit SRP54